MAVRMRTTIFAAFSSCSACAVWTPMSSTASMRSVRCFTCTVEMSSAPTSPWAKSLDSASVRWWMMMLLSTSAFASRTSGRHASTMTVSYASRTAWWSDYDNESENQRMHSIISWKQSEAPD